MLIATLSSYSLSLIYLRGKVVKAAATDIFHDRLVFIFSSYSMCIYFLHPRGEKIK